MAEGAVSISDLKRDQPARETRLAPIQPGFGDLASFELMQRGAKVLASSTLVPEQFRGPEGLPNAIVALNMALRMQADPLMVMQNLYVVHGRPAWSAQFLIATFNRSGRYSALRYEWEGTRGKDDWGCRAWAKELATGDRITGPLVTMQTAKDEKWIERAGSKWKTIPELMLTYRAAAWFVRTNAPEIAMGLPTAEEREDMVTLTREEYTTAQLAGNEHIRHAVDTDTGEIATGAAANGDVAKDAAKTDTASSKDVGVGVTYAVVMAKLEDAAKKKDVDLLDAHATLIVSAPAEHHVELKKKYQELRAQIAPTT